MFVFGITISMTAPGIGDEPHIYKFNQTASNALAALEMAYAYAREVHPRGVDGIEVSIVKVGEVG